MVKGLLLVGGNASSTSERWATCSEVMLCPVGLFQKNLQGAVGQWFWFVWVFYTVGRLSSEPLYLQLWKSATLIIANYWPTTQNSWMAYHSTQDRLAFKDHPPRVISGTAVRIGRFLANLWWLCSSVDSVKQEISWIFTVCKSDMIGQRSCLGAIVYPFWGVIWKKKQNLNVLMESPGWWYMGPLFWNACSALQRKKWNQPCTFIASKTVGAAAVIGNSLCPIKFTQYVMMSDEFYGSAQIPTLSFQCWYFDVHCLHSVKCLELRKRERVIVTVKASVKEEEAAISPVKPKLRWTYCWLFLTLVVNCLIIMSNVAHSVVTRWLCLRIV